MEANENVRFAFDLLDMVNKFLDDESKPNDLFSKLRMEEMITEHMNKVDPPLSNHCLRLTHFILYLNTNLENCHWVKVDPTLNLKRYVHGKSITGDIFCKIVKILNLKQFTIDTIICTPYDFWRDLFDMHLKYFLSMRGAYQLYTYEYLLISLIKSVKQTPVKANLESSLISHFNQSLIMYGKDFIPKEVNIINGEINKNEMVMFRGLRIRNILKVFVEIIQFKNTNDLYRQYPMYKLQSLRDSSIISENDLFKKFFDTIMYKCIELCDFCVDDWLSWYELKAMHDEFNLQKTIGHLCFELCSLIENKTIDEPYLNEYLPMLRNIAIEKVDFDIDTNDINGMLKHIEKFSSIHINDWIKKMIENINVFSHTGALKKLDSCITFINYDCFLLIVDRCLQNYKNNTFLLELLGSILLKGIMHLCMEDKILLLKHVIINYDNININLSDNINNALYYIVKNEYNNGINQEELFSKLIWLVMHNPKKVFHILLSQYISGIFGYPRKSIESPKSCLLMVLISIHTHMKSESINEEYIHWLEKNSKDKNDILQINLRDWIIDSTRILSLINPKKFLLDIIIPLIQPKSNYNQLIFLVDLTKYFLTEFHLLATPDAVLIEVIWDKLLSKLSKLLDDTRWNINNFTNDRVELCEKVIDTIQPLLHRGSYIIKPKELDILNKHLSSMHLLTRAHFLYLWPPNHVKIDGMDDKFIMTVHSQFQLSYINLNRSSTQRTQEEFVFSIATFLPKLTLFETQTFVDNYLLSATTEQIIDASYFLCDSVMSAFMRIIVYLKTAILNDNISDEIAWHYLYHGVVNFFDTVSSTRLCSIYSWDINANMVCNSLNKLFMVVKQMPTLYQRPLLVVIRRMINIIHERLDSEKLSNILQSIVSIKTLASKEELGSVSNMLARKINGTSES